LEWELKQLVVLDLFVVERWLILNQDRCGNHISIFKAKKKKSVPYHKLLRHISEMILSLIGNGTLGKKVMDHILDIQNQ
jgi:hypothetical protein